jgi:hypothetical protein
MSEGTWRVLESGNCGLCDQLGLLEAGIVRRMGRVLHRVRAVWACDDCRGLVVNSKRLADMWVADGWTFLRWTADEEFPEPTTAVVRRGRDDGRAGVVLKIGDSPYRRVGWAWPDDWQDAAETTAAYADVWAKEADGDDGL